MKLRLSLVAVGLLLCTSLSALAAEGEGGDYGKKSGVIPNFVFGPKATLLGTPVPFRIGAETKWDNFLGASFDWGFLPNISFSNVSVKLNGWNVAAKIYPWKSAFFVGLAMGSQTFTGSQTGTVLFQPTTVTTVVSSTYVAPQIGWRWVWSSGFYFGMELGVQIPLSTSAATTSDKPSLAGQPEYLLIQSQINDKANTYAKNPFPHFGLVQIGYYF